ncbi:cilia- and flagella- associated protein 210-like [Aphelocoma coerulescens]|uniref:cilia- and flagella- associated protein 210-like n=1 Tax=Aphelocoma coerulescens TaxID=39617 RepID=UPI003604D43C
MPGERHQLGVTQPYNKARGLGCRCQRPEAASRNAKDSHKLCPLTDSNSHHLKENNVLHEYFLPNEADLHQVIVFPKAEWERIQGSTREAAHNDEKKEQEEVHLDSKAAGKDPPNATVSLIQQKLQAKKLREEKEEEERKLLDLEEAQFQAAKRKEVIDRVKTYLGYQDDRMRQFHSALLLTKVLKERDAQIEFQKSRLVDSKKKDYEEGQRQFKEYILSEQEKAHQHYTNQQALRKDQLEQIKEREHQADLAKQENKREEEEIQRSIQLYQLEIQRKEEKKHEEKVERRRLYHQFFCAMDQRSSCLMLNSFSPSSHLLPPLDACLNREAEEYVNDQKIIKAIEEQKQMEEDDRIKAHFKAKEIIANMRKKKEAEMRRLAQERQDKMIRRLAEHMGEGLKMEGVRLARDVARIEAEQEKKRKEKEAKQKAALESIAEHRATVMKMKEENERQEKEEAEKERDVLMENARIYQEMENTKKHRRHEANREVQKIQIQQMAEKQARKEQEKQAELDYDAQREAIALSKKHEFQKYAKQVIEIESKTTHHLYPLLKACKGERGLGHGPFF